MYVVKHNSTGGAVWGHSYGNDSSSDSATALGVDWSTGDVYFGGGFLNSVSVGGRRITTRDISVLLVKTDANGTIQWSNYYYPAIIK